MQSVRPRHGFAPVRGECGAANPSVAALLFYRSPGTHATTSMLLERRTVSRKTAGDGRLEITKIAAAQCDVLGSTFDVELNGERQPARMRTMDCTCRGVDNPHVHHF